MVLQIISDNYLRIYGVTAVMRSHRVPGHFAPGVVWRRRLLRPDIPAVACTGENCVQKLFTPTICQGSFLQGHTATALWSGWRRLIWPHNPVVTALQALRSVLTWSGLYGHSCFVTI